MSNSGKFTNEPDAATVIQLDAEGGVTIPLPVWRGLGIGAGDYVTLSRDGERIKIKPAKSKGSGNE